jgi:hypothetical protein
MRQVGGERRVADRRADGGLRHRQRAAGRLHAGRQAGAGQGTERVERRLAVGAGGACQRAFETTLEVFEQAILGGRAGQVGGQFWQRAGA